MKENKKLNKEGNTATPYDDVYRTLLHDCASLIIPVVNEVFQKRYGKDEKVTVIAMSKKVLEALTEKYTNVQEGVKKIIGGQILDYEAKRILNKGRQEGIGVEELYDEELQSIYNEICPK